jgi:hypothetical protein
LHIKVLRTSSSPFRTSSKTPDILGKLSTKIIDLIENGEGGIHTLLLLLTVPEETSLPLTDESGGENGAHVAFKLTIHTDTATMLDSNDVNTRITKAKEAAQTVGPWDAPLRKALQSLEQIMNIVGGIAEVIQSCSLHATCSN